MRYGITICLIILIFIIPNDAICVDIIKTSICGYYLGEREERLLARAKEKGIEYDIVDGEDGLLFYCFSGQLDGCANIYEIYVMVEYGIVREISILYNNVTDNFMYSITNQIKKIWGAKSYYLDKGQYILLVEKPPIEIAVARRTTVYPKVLVIEVRYMFWYDDPSMIEFIREIVE